MAGYWLRILLGALAVFAVGMLVVRLVEQGRETVHLVTETSDPIDLPIPPGLLAFRLDGESVGAVRRIRILRSATDRPDSLLVQATLHDSVALPRLDRCLLLIDDLQRIELTKTTFRCGAPEDTVGRGYTRIGRVSLRGNPGRSYALYGLQSDVHAIRHDAEHRAERVADSAERAADSAEAVADSISEAAERRADSISSAVESMSESLRTAMEQRADSIRADAERRAEAIRRAAPSR